MGGSTHSSNEPYSRFRIRKDPYAPLPSSDLFVHTLQHVRGTEPGSVLLRQTHHSHGILKALFQAGDGLGSDLGKAPLRPPVFFWLRPYREPRGSASPHGPLHSCTSKTYALRRCASDGPGISAREPLEVLLDGPGQPRMIIRDHIGDALEASSLQLLQSSSQDKRLSESPKARPRTSLEPFSLTPTAIRAALESALSSSLSLMNIASRIRKGKEPSNLLWRNEETLASSSVASLYPRTWRTSSRIGP